MPIPSGGAQAGAHHAAPARDARQHRRRARSSSIEWASVYTFQCRRMERFRHGRVLFAGDSAHGVSPFGARGANSGVQDADNLAWKLAARAAARGAATRCSTATTSEREAAADENIRNSTRATDFITPKSAVSRACSATRCSSSPSAMPFARALVNSGRLSVPTVLARLAAEHARRAMPSRGAMVPGAPAADAPVVRATAAAAGCCASLGGRLHAAGLRRPCDGGRAQALARGDRAECRSCTVARAAASTTIDEGLVRRRAMTRKPGTVLPVAPRPARVRALARVPTPRRCAPRCARAGQALTRDRDGAEHHPNLDAPDDFYEALLDAHRGPDDAQSARATPSSCCCSPTTSVDSTCCARRSTPRAPASLTNARSEP